LQGEEDRDLEKRVQGKKAAAKKKASKRSEIQSGYIQRCTANNSQKDERRPRPWKRRRRRRSDRRAI
jgi:hypothetical protein